MMVWEGVGDDVGGVTGGFWGDMCHCGCYK